MKILFPAWNIDPVNWARLKNTLQPIAAHNELTVIYPNHYPELTEPWANFIAVPSYQTIRMVDLQALTDFALKIIMQLDTFDMVYCFSSGPYFQLINLMLAKLGKVPCVMHINGNGALARSFFMQAGEKLQQDAVDLLGLNSTDVLVPISSNLERVMQKLVIEPARVAPPVPFSVDLDIFNPGPQPSKLCIGYAGRISPEKGTPFLLQLMAETPELKYRMAGPIEKMEGTFPENCSYTGVFEHYEMRYFYVMNSVMVLPSHGEGISALLLEAYACGRPVIGTPECHPEELPLIGWEVPMEKEAWLKTLRSVTTKEAAKRGREARAFIEKKWPSWEDFGTAMQAHFERAHAG